MYIIHYVILPHAGQYYGYYKLLNTLRRMAQQEQLAEQQQFFGGNFGNIGGNVGGTISGQSGGNRVGANTYTQGR